MLSQFRPPRTDEETEKAQGAEKPKDPEDKHDKDGDGVLDPNMPKQEAMDRFNKGVFTDGTWTFEDLWNTRHGASPGMSKYWEDLEPGQSDPRIGEDKKYDEDRKKEEQKGKLKVFTDGGLANVANEDQGGGEGEGDQGLVQFSNSFENIEFENQKKDHKLY